MEQTQNFNIKRLEKMGSNGDQNFQKKKSSKSRKNENFGKLVENFKDEIFEHFFERSGKDEKPHVHPKFYI